MSRFFEDRVLRRIFRPEEGECNRKMQLHNEELHNFYSSPTTNRVIKSRRMNQAGHVARMAKIPVLVGELEGKRQLGRPKCRWEDNISTDLNDTGCDAVDWIQLDQYRMQ
jgi:hypothetical protein